MSNETVEVILTLPASSIRKVRSLAMLAGITVGDVEAQMAQMFDDMLSHNIRAQLDAVDGKVPDLIDSPPKQYAAVAGFATHAAAKGDVVAIHVAPPDTVAEVPGSETDHSLSGDDDNGDTKSVEDEVNELLDDGAVDGIPNKPFNIDIQDVGENHDAYLDAAMGTKPRQAAPQQQRTRAARTAFDPRAPRVRVISTAEDEDSGDLPGFNG